MNGRRFIGPPQRCVWCHGHAARVDLVRIMLGPYSEALRCSDVVACVRRQYRTKLTTLERRRVA